MTDRAVQATPLWMTLLDALQHIRAATNCGCVQAQVWLKNAIRHGTIPVKWGASKRRSPRVAQPVLSTPARTPNDGRVLDLEYFQGSQLVLAEPGLAFDPKSERLRPVLVLRSAVTSTAWPPGDSDATTQGHRDAATQEREEGACWMTLVQAVEHIRVLQDCNQVKALQQLKTEIHDGTVAVKWFDADLLEERKMCTAQTESDFLLVGAGLALDQHEGTYRPLLCNLSAVQTLWTSPDDKSSTSTPTQIAPAKAPELRPSPAGAGPPQSVASTPNSTQDQTRETLKRKKGRPSTKQLVWDTLSQMKLKNLSFDCTDMELARKVAEINDKKLGESRGWRERTILAHVSKWRAKNLGY